MAPMLEEVPSAMLHDAFLIDLPLHALWLKVSFFLVVASMGIDELYA